MSGRREGRGVDASCAYVRVTCQRSYDLDRRPRLGAQTDFVVMVQQSFSIVAFVAHAT